MDKPSASLRLKAGREKPVINLHPWIFSGSIDKIVGGKPEPGDLVDVVKSDGSWLAIAYYNPHSQIQARILTWDPEQAIDEIFWEKKLTRAIQNREALQFEPQTTAYRLVNAESDGLPGLIVDKYGEFLVIQCLTMGIDKRKKTLVELLVGLLNPSGILERSDVNVRKKEGLTKIVSFITGERPPQDLVVNENDLRVIVDPYHGHKTGYYLDQRENRAFVCQKLFVAERKILNLFAYTGGFSINAAANGASSIINVESSSRFLSASKDILNLNNIQRPNDEYIVGDAFQVLREFRDTQRQFDVAIIDPPKMANTRSDVQAACRGYKDLNLLALQLLRPGGLLATFSCSGLISRELFQKVLFGAAVDAGRNLQIIHNLSQAADHPILVTFPESEYLTGFLCRVN